jgi:cysteinyl-tRNA synthetase
MICRFFPIFSYIKPMPLELYNTLTREKERFKPLRQDEVKVYYCGPTPYNYAHIGNLRAYLFEDFVIRTLRFLGYKVRTVMNITDIDDKTIRDSQKSGKNLKEFTEFYTEAFLSDLTKLHIHHADTIAPISGLIDEMSHMIQ